MGYPMLRRRLVNCTYISHSSCPPKYSNNDSMYCIYVCSIWIVHYTHGNGYHGYSCTDNALIAVVWITSLKWLSGELLLSRLCHLAEGCGTGVPLQCYRFNQCIDDSLDSNQMIHNKSLLTFRPHAVSFIRVRTSNKLKLGNNEKSAH